MRYPLDELLDKRSIIKLKIERIEDDIDRERLREEYKDYSEAIKEFITESTCTQKNILEWSEMLYEANGKIWNLEANIRKGQIGDLSLKEIGLTAIKIRESNGIRVGIKSSIVQTIGQGYTDIKINHASEKTLKNYL
jgi:hypothetical protein